MKSLPSSVHLATAAALLAIPVAAQNEPDRPSFAYHRATEQLVERGMQAFMICNGRFVSERPLDLIYDQELKLNLMPVLPPWEVEIDEGARTVAVGTASNDPVPTMRAAYRRGLGCIVMAPDQTFADLDSLPSLDLPPAAGDPAKTAWPDGDLVPKSEPPSFVDTEALTAAGDWALNRATHGHRSQITLSLMVVHDGQILLERYAPGVDQTTRTRTWSTAKSIAVTLIGQMVANGRLSLDEPLPFADWGPTTGPDDPRRRITLRHVLQMSSGLYPVDNGNCNTVGSCLSYWAGGSSVKGALDRGLVREPGANWDYENYDTLLAVHAMETVIGDRQAYLELPRRALLDRIGMRSTLPGVDRFGNYVMSSQIYTNARDLARFGLLYLNEGRWNGEQIIPASWVDFVRTPAPSTLQRGAMYGGQWWLVPDRNREVPPDAYSTAGNRGQYVVVVPSYDLVIVRRGLDTQPGRHGFSQWDLTREVLKAFPKQPWGAKPTATGAGR